MNEARATFQGFPCQAAEYNNPQGLAPGRGYVILPQQSLTEIIEGDAWLPHSGGDGKGGETPREQKPKGGASALSGPLRIRGDLVLEFGDEVRVLRNLYATEIEDVKRSATDEEDVGLVRVTLTDIRALWQTRGDFHGAYNILASRSGLAPAVDTDPTAPTFEITSTKPDGKPYTLYDMARLCLDRLPGRMQILGTKAALQTMRDIIPHGLDYQAEPAIEVLRALLGAWNIRMALDLSADAVAFWLPTEGKPELSHTGGRLDSLSFVTAGGEVVALRPERVASWQRVTQRQLKPRSVRIVGKRIVREWIEDLVPVGDLHGQIVPLPMALGYYGMSMNDAARWVLLPKDAQEAWVRGSDLLDEEAITEMRRWAFKWFALKPAARRVFDPILPYRARSMVDHTQRPPIVWADRADEARLNRAISLFARELDETQRWVTQSIDGVSAELQKVTAELEASAGGFSTGQSAIGLLQDAGNRLRQIVTQEAISSEQADTQDRRTLLLQREGFLAEQITSLRRLAEIRRASLKLVDANELVRINHALARRNPADYRIDRDRVVKFIAPVGLIGIDTRVGTPQDQAVSGGSRLLGQPVPGSVSFHAGSLGPAGAGTVVRSMETLGTNPQVRMLFAYQQTPRTRSYFHPFDPGGSNSLDKAVTDYPDNYSYLAALDGDKVVRLNEASEPVNSATLYPRVVRHDMQQWTDIQGHDNVRTLDILAASIAKRELSGDEQTSGHSGEVIGFPALSPTGVVAFVDVSMSAGGRPSTRWRAASDSAVEARQITQTRIPGTQGLATSPGSILNSGTVGRR